jgi:uncharacterized membrane protein YqjE
MDPNFPNPDGDTRARDFGAQSSFASWSFSELFKEMGEQFRRLVRGEVELAKAELREEVTQVKASAGVLAGGAVALLLGGIAFVAFAIAVLDTFLPLWLAAGIVMVLLLGGGALAMKAGLERIKKVHKPTRTIQTLKEDSQWASRTAQSMKSQMQGHA